jgi:hypothetical protein
MLCLIPRLLTWPLRAARELWWVRGQLPRMRAEAVEAIRVSILTDGQ